MFASENHIATGNWRRLTAAAMLALALASGAMAATSGNADAAVAKPRLDATIVATTTGAPHAASGIAPNFASASGKCRKKKKNTCNANKRARAIAGEFGKKLKKLDIDKLHKRSNEPVCDKCRTGNTGNGGGRNINNIDLDMDRNGPEPKHSRPEDIGVRGHAG
ncbi:hypothetical protein ACFXJ8_43220 [Nonomuraea sp. NPDC059194]|uniref:hypothetical protein n=1 Tax=Nonomuraea sp. NPDC059194 TaxID=3346764 RepID=UPI0036B14FCD